MGKDDLQLWTKYVGEKFFTQIPLESFGPLPKIEHQEFSPIKQRMRQDSTKRQRSPSPQGPSKFSKILEDDVFNTSDVDKFLNEALDAATQDNSNLKTTAGTSK